jgi:hypothetical protein
MRRGTLEALLARDLGGRRVMACAAGRMRLKVRD